MPTQRPRVSWILSQEVIDDIKLAAKGHFRPIAMEAELALRGYINDLKANEPDLFDVEFSKENPGPAQARR